MTSQCNHPSNILKPSQSGNKFCANCGIILSQRNTISTFSLIKPDRYAHKTDIDPILYLKQIEAYANKKAPTGISYWYSNNRRSAIKYLKLLCKGFNVSDKTFFSALSYMDTVLSPVTILNSKKCDLIVISCFILAGKFSENDSYPFELNNFISSNKHYLFNASDVMHSEQKTLKLLNYNLNNISAFEYLSSVLNSGILFENEIDDKEQIDTIYSFCFKLFIKIMYSEIPFEFNLFQIIFSMVYLTRRQFGLSKEKMSIINQIYGVHYLEYLQCADTITK